MKRFAISIFYVVALALLLSNVPAAQAKTLAAKVNNAPTLGEQVASPSDTLVPIPVPASSPSVVEAYPVCKDRCIKYHHHGRLRKICCGCDEPIKMVLAVKDPCCCCTVDVEVCLPGCCKEAPSVCSHPGIFGRQIVEYTWCCGYRVKVIFDRCGDVAVHSYAR